MGWMLVMSMPTMLKGLALGARAEPPMRGRGLLAVQDDPFLHEGYSIRKQCQQAQRTGRGRG